MKFQKLYISQDFIPLDNPLSYSQLFIVVFISVIPPFVVVINSEHGPPVYI